ncbi:MAG: hypothetical protein RBR96_05310 [Candidatus Izemoplasmatales bacterium]|jgi:hypothetical protein|nr:hypothetical protein [Candidatus Izemoplasmatales bacterium]
MKKLFMLFIMMFAVLGFVACNNNGGSDVEVNYDEQIAFPTNLRIEGKILKWDAVAEADGYIVYVDGEKVKSVSKNEYDFSGLDGDRLVFTVVTNAPRGMQDSEHSVSIAYMANKTEETAAMKLAVSTSGLPLSDEFAEELVNKGMLASEFEAMVDAITTMTETEIDGPEEAYAAIDTMMESVTNVEAVISAFVKTMLPDLIDDQIASLEDDKEYYQEQIDNGWDYNGYYQDRIDELDDQIQVMEDLKDQIAASSEDVVKTILVVMEYIMSIEEMVTADLITNIANLSETSSPEDLNVEELVLVKDEIVNILTQTMPTQSELVLVINTLNSFVGLLETVEEVQIGELANPEKMAGTMLLSFEAYLKFIENFDLDFFTELKAIAVSDDSEAMIQAQVAILVITYFDDFLAENEELLDNIEAVYTDAEKEEMFNDYMDMVESYWAENEDAPITEVNFLSFQKTMALKAIFEEAFEDLLDAFVASEGEILLLIAEQQDWQDTFWDQDDPVWEEHDYFSQYYQFKIMDQAVYLLNSVISGRSQDDFIEVRGLFIDAYKEFINEIVPDATYTQVQSLVTAIDAFLANTTEEEYELIQSLAAYMDEEDVFLDYANAFETLYSDDYDAIYGDDSNYFQIAFAFDVYSGYMTSGNRANIDVLIDEAGILLATSYFAQYNLSEYPEIAKDLLDYIDTVDNEVAGFDYTNLTTANKTRIDEILTELQEIVMPTV